MMKEIKCYIIDDNQDAIDILASYIEKTPGLELLGGQLNPLTALNYIERKLIIPDITFVDINMPEINGIELAELIEEYTNIIFYSSFTNYAISAFETTALDFLAKPLSYNRFLKSVEKIKKTQVDTDPNTSFFLKNLKGKAASTFQINFQEIIYIKALGNYIQIKTSAENLHTIYMTLKSANENLPKQDFCRISKSYIVNLKHIEIIKDKVVIMKDTSKLNLSDNFKREFTQQINAWSIG
ncbi:DNA-binding LytR/AlgR family response regulator [Pedobacter cryoconitis]|uniref:DNA-binding LytR/AlgR family response regulator n=1 Tax=Pedobacter cryoconitis TaxID=188932 RepID=A0A7W8ZJN1_9SPHI|nr:LytTR family DNA-binding domain-containing protein [Pedobacter cryoconitis]MBB5635117.1 DNA-binding LytR/AlgR family response regulator [Pedobacter cryoconitis]MBB6271699.1 DNA-binding LytR/AlgR family response regulator [Pedobacter cryoconitis]